MGHFVSSLRRLTDFLVGLLHCQMPAEGSARSAVASAPGLCETEQQICSCSDHCLYAHCSACSLCKSTALKRTDAPFLAEASFDDYGSKSDALQQTSFKDVADLREDGQARIEQDMRRQ